MIKPDGEEGTSTGYGKRFGRFRVMWQRGEFVELRFTILAYDFGLQVSWHKVPEWARREDGS